MRLLPTIATMLCVAGAVCAALGHVLYANIFWVISNPLLILHLYKESEYELIRMYLVFTAIAVYGVINLW